MVFRYVNALSEQYNLPVIINDIRQDIYSYRRDNLSWQKKTSVNDVDGAAEIFVCIWKKKLLTDKPIGLEPGK